MQLNDRFLVTCLPCSIKNNTFFPDKRFSVDDEQMLFFTNLVNESIDTMQGPAAILNILPWLELVLPSYFRNKVMRIDRIELQRDRTREYFKVKLK